MKQNPDELLEKADAIAKEAGFCETGEMWERALEYRNKEIDLLREAIQVQKDILGEMVRLMIADNAKRKANET